jgi:hypothetical protein
MMVRFRAVSVDDREIKSKRSLITSFVASIGVAFFVRLGEKNWEGTGWDWASWVRDWGTQAKKLDKETSDSGVLYDSQ